MDDVYKDNFKQAIASSQKALYSASVIALFVWILAKSEVLEEIKLPILGFSVEANFGVLVVMLLYTALGAQLMYCLSIASKNLKMVESTDLRQALLLSPSVLNGSLAVRVTAVMAPFLILLSAMHTAFSGNWAAAFLVAIVYSTFHFIAASYSYEIK